MGERRRETNETQEPQPSFTQSSRRGILKNRQGSRAVSTAALTDIIANHANQETSPNVESEHTVTVGSGLHIELPERTQPTSQREASTVPTQHDNQDEETIAVPRSNTEGIPENGVTGQGLVIVGSTEEVRSLPETKEASTSMDEDVLLWTTAQSEGDEQSIILMAGPTVSTTTIHAHGPPVRPEPPTQEERRMEPPVSSASEITEAKNEPVYEVEDERPPPAEEQENDNVPALTIVQRLLSKYILN